MPGLGQIGGIDYLQGMARWPGVGQVVSCTYTVSHGITPGTAVLTIAPTDLADIAEVGDLIITDGARTFPLKDCHVVEPSYSAGAGGQVMRLVIEDHRHRWRQCGAISGRYNVPEERYFDVPPASTPQWGAPQGNQPHPPYIPPGEEPIRKETKKTAPELAALLLKAMGETAFDVSGLDPTATPSVNWDTVNPAVALQTLVESLGCAVVWQPLTASTLITPVGSGGPLPDGPVLEEAPSLSVKARPEKVTCWGAPARYQLRFDLEAVGLDFDGTIIPIDNLTYKPVGKDGWATASTAPPSFMNLPGPLTPGGPERVGQNGASYGKLPGRRTFWDAVALAQHSVYRMYRITLKAASGGPLTIPPDGKAKLPGKVKDRRQVRLLAVKNDASKDDIGGMVQWPATCYGRHTRPRAVLVGKRLEVDYDLTDASTEVKVPFSIDVEHQTIVFAEPVYAFTKRGGRDTARFFPADIILECACEVLDPVTWAPYRYSKTITIDTGLPGTEAFIVKDDVRYQEVAQYGKGGVFNALKSVTGNASRIAPRADHYLVGESQRYVTAGAERRKYIGVQLIDPDGAIMQVTWSIGGGDLSTTASLNTEHNLYVPSFLARRRQELSDLNFFKQPDRVIIPPSDPFGGTAGIVIATRGS